MALSLMAAIWLLYSSAGGSPGLCLAYTKKKKESEKCSVFNEHAKDCETGESYTAGRTG